MLYSSLIERALRVAASAHAGQFRKQTAIPYFTHLAGTALVLLRAGFHDEDVLAAALLHDAIEDGDLNPSQIQDAFGKNVALYVLDATEVKHNAKGVKQPWEVRKDEHIQRIRSRSVESRAIVLADKIHNLGTICDDVITEPSVWQRFNAPPEKVYAYYEAMIDIATSDPRLTPFYKTGNLLLEQLRTSLPAH